MYVHKFKSKAGKKPESHKLEIDHYRNGIENNGILSDSERRNRGDKIITKA